MLVLVVEHDAETQNCIATQVQAAGHNCFCVSSEAQAHAWLSSACPDVVLVDMLLPDSDHRQLSRSIQKTAPGAKIVVLARPGATHSIQEALDWGADDYLEKPVNELRLTSILKHFRQLHRPSSGRGCLPNAFFNGDQTQYKKALSKFKKAAKLDIPIVFEGAPGTGKTTAAQHFLKETLGEMPIILLDASTEAPDAFSRKLSNLNGDSKTRRFGILIRHLEAANRRLQSAIKKQLESSHQIMVATSNGRLMDHMESGLLDADLFSKMSAAPFWLAPIGERKHDRELLSRQFLAQANAELSTHVPQTALTRINPAFPDNIRGLKKAIYATIANDEPTKTGLTSADSATLMTAHAPAQPAIQTSVKLLDKNGNLKSLEEIEAESIEFAFAHLDGRLGKIAKSLKLGRTTLYRKLTRLKLTQNQPVTEDEQNAAFVHQSPEKAPARAA